MSFVDPEQPTVLVRADEAEEVGGPTSLIRLLADASDTGGRLSSQRVTLGRGTPGAVPHRHDTSGEFFYLLDGEVDVLSGDAVLRVRAGDALYVPPGTPHAFAAAPDAPADLLIVLTPGVERFEYFRHLARIGRGEVPRESLLAEQARYDTYFLASDAWDRRAE